MTPEDDPTVRLPPAVAPVAAPAAPPPPPPRVPPAAPPPRASRAGLLAGAAGVALLAAGAAWWLLQGSPPAPVAPPVAIPVPAPAPAPPQIATPAVPAPAPAPPAALARPLPPLLDEAAILAHRAEVPRLLRLADNPAVFVIDFPTLEEQGAAMNRVAALIEKAGLPRDRVLGDAELAEAIARSGDTPATYYFGHNYRGVHLDRFFRLAARDGVRLSAAEAWLEAQFRLARSLVPEGAEIAILTIAAAGPRMDDSGRAAILRHELGHGLLATRPAYAEHVRRVWRDRFTEPERAAFRAFLGREGYDTTNEELMLDEAQAYLLHTPDPRFFSPSHVGMTEQQVARLRALLREGAPYLPR